eukprot:TRINITY_DN61396_c0_g1_i1.p1 TRINITY_DN61396_c0_g1~~TRINITY_DN61396_c0_g1_i1.p1  ORF type:complete len:330 (+),score=72.35 TRINITY_DN61396_c0_g1_i1:86-1075(+)
MDEDAFDWEVRDSSTPFCRHAVAGSCAGIVEHVSMYPVDTVKTRMQASHVPIGGCEAMRAVLRERGVVGLMRGSTVIGAGCIPAHIGLFGTYELTMARLVDRQSEDLQPLRAAFCGGAAAVVHDTVLTPHDVVKQRLQLGHYGGARHCVASMLQHEGLAGFYRSLPATLAMNVPYTGMLVAANESLKLLLRVRQGEKAQNLSTAGYFLCAGISGAIAAAATSPLDVLKTRLQTQGLSAAAVPAVPSTAAVSPASQQGMFTTFLAILREGGVRGLFRGVGPRILMASPAAAISWGTYESVRMLLEDLDKGHDIDLFSTTAAPVTQVLNQA